jgi:hypothetical protein
MKTDPRAKRGFSIGGKNMLTALFFITPAALLLAVAGIITDHFNFWI